MATVRYTEALQNGTQNGNTQPKYGFGNKLYIYTVLKEGKLGFKQGHNVKMLSIWRPFSKMATMDYPETLHFASTIVADLWYKHIPFVIICFECMYCKYNVISTIRMSRNFHDHIFPIFGRWL